VMLQSGISVDFGRPFCECCVVVSMWPSVPDYFLNSCMNEHRIGFELGKSCGYNRHY